MIVVAVAIGGFFVFVGNRVLRRPARPFATGEEELAGADGDVRVALDPIGQVFVAGALWRARASERDEPIEVGYRVSVEAIDGLTSDGRRRSRTAPQEKLKAREWPEANRKEADRWLDL